MKITHDSMFTGGIDISKSKLDVAVDGSAARLTTSNDAAGHEAVIRFLRQHQITRVGLEATGSYGLLLETALRREEFEVVVLQPIQVKLFRKLQLKNAKTDAIDAVLIASFTARQAGKTDFHDPRTPGLCERLLYIEQLKTDATRIRARLDRFFQPDLVARMKRDIQRIECEAREMFDRLMEEVRTHPDLARRIDLLLSIPGIGNNSALVLVLRMPELGHLSREQIAALVGIAPFNRDSGRASDPRRITGGRKTVRDALYTPTVSAATRWNPDLVVFYKRLKANGKPAKLAIIAAMRKLLAMANAILARQTPWKTKKTQQ
jgi:transposase